ncbi:hypothetical protein [Parasphingorhabdus halotolerans]|nr:hypothetical protein [Parasphingorhabdus halotolerans]
MTDPKVDQSATKDASFSAISNVENIRLKDRGNGGGAKLWHSLSVTS